MPPANPELEHALADAIRSGADRRPEQAFGDYFHGRHASCALGAAYEGMYRLPDDMEGRRPTKDLEEYFDCLDGHGARRAPVEGCRKVLTLSALYRPPERRPPSGAARPSPPGSRTAGTAPPPSEPRSGLPHGTNCTPE